MDLDAPVVPARQALVAHLREHAVRTDGPFRLRSGATADWYVDARQTTFDGEGALLVGRAVTEALLDEVTAVGGMTQGADPIAVAAAVVAALAGRELRAFSVRKQAKDHGAGGRLVGPLRPDDRICVVEDTTTTGSAIVETIDVLTDAGMDVVQVISLVDRSGGRVRERLGSLPYVALVEPEELGVG